MPSIFICYSHQDSQWFERVSQYLKTFEILGIAEPWSDRKLKIGEEWDQTIKDNLKQANAAVLLISQAFLTSQYIRNVEVPAILAKREIDPHFVILPIVLELCLLEKTTFKYPDAQKGPKEISLSVFQTANSPSQPLDGLPKHEQNQIFVSVAERLFEIFKSDNEREKNRAPLLVVEPATSQLTEIQRRHLEQQLKEQQQEYNYINQEIDFLSNSEKIEDLRPKERFRLQQQIAEAKQKRDKTAQKIEELEKQFDC